jgi:hypothetical protein
LYPLSPQDYSAEDVSAALATCVKKDDFVTKQPNFLTAPKLHDVFESSILF